LDGDGFTDEVYLTDYADFADFFGRSLLLIDTKTIGSMSWSHTTKGDVFELFDLVFSHRIRRFRRFFTLLEVYRCISDKGLWRRLENSHLIVFDLLEMQAYLQS
jgi:hypothetical protein